MHDNYDLRQEQLNKASLLSSKKFLEALLDQFENRAVINLALLCFVWQKPRMLFDLPPNN